ncbi:HAMP domain-containing sensor histidine kinase [uncultured Tissierella sp.]|uniref:sensor histidine kinase n=1 Tax=uncultured Tissierella sp. TaxID=448160 RepID=UPI002804C6F2|nr:HAMP domain-containing sensor histidine kinase [uncultured Tissierella sp.]MDU5080872.1 HAMP domain-containing sensor histidine kinase [Bacillota bacterium]
MRKSIKTRLVKSFMLIIIITVVILEVVLINGMKDYYYKNIEDILSNQIEFSIDYYLRYFSLDRLEDIVIDDIDVFWQHTTAQVQILNSDGKLIMDSLGVTNDNSNLYPDIKKAINGEKGVWIGNVNYYNSPVMSVSAAIKDQDRVIGIIRFITSLKETNGVIRFISFLLLGMGVIVVFISGMVSVFLANSIIRPLQEVTRVAEKMADGQLKVRSDIELEDEIGRLSDTLNYMAEELVKKEQIKNDFISSVSHELRTPLTSIKGWAATLKCEDFGGNEIMLDGLEIIEKESDRLSIMVEELLDFSRFVSGRIKLENDEFQIKDTIEMIGKQLTPRAVNNRIEFIINIDQSLGYMLGDENRIKQVLINLLDNAFKFTSEDGKVILNAYKENDILVLEVKDNGVGISEEDLPKVKEKFYKGKNSKSHSGIGLSICDEIVKLHNGTMEILSNINEGTRVIVRLPLREVS